MKERRFCSQCLYGFGFAFFPHADCGYLTSLEGWVASPNYPSLYPHKTECSRTIEAGEVFDLKLTLEDINVRSVK